MQQASKDIELSSLAPTQRLTPKENKLLPISPRSDADARRILLKAIKRDEFDLFERLLAEGVDINTVMPNVEMPLIVASRYPRHNRFFLRLLDYGADINVYSRGGYSVVVHVALMALWSLKEKSEVLAILRENQQGLERIHEAATLGNVDYMFAPENIETLKRRDTFGNSVLHYAAANGHLPIVLRLMVEGYIPVGDRSHEGETALHWASYSGHLPLIQWLCTEGDASLDEQESDDQDNLTPFLIAGIKEHTIVMNYFMKVNHDIINDKDRAGRTVFLYAVLYGYLNLVRLLSTGRPFCLAERTIQGDTALMLACGAGHLEIVQYLISKNASVKERNKAGSTPLLEAAYGGHEEVVRVLLKQKASVHEKDKQGFTAVLHAAANNCLSVMDVLLAHDKTCIKVKLNTGETPLMVAAGSGHLQVVIYLLALGQTQSDELNKAADEAINRNQLAVLQWLVQKGGVIVQRRRLRAYAGEPEVSGARRWMLDNKKLLHDQKQMREKVFQEMELRNLWRQFKSITDLMPMLIPVLWKIVFSYCEVEFAPIPPKALGFDRLRKELLDSAPKEQLKDAKKTRQLLEMCESEEELWSVAWHGSQNPSFWFPKLSRILEQKRILPPSIEPALPSRVIRPAEEKVRASLEHAQAQLAQLPETHERYQEFSQILGQYSARSSDVLGGLSFEEHRALCRLSSEIMALADQVQSEETSASSILHPPGASPS